MRRVRLLFIFSILALVLATCANAQEATGKVVGTITDQTGAVIPGVGVEPFKSRMDTPCLPALDNRVFPFQGYSRISTFLQDGSGLLKTAAELVL